jgi:methylenetetrahydrofolate reductase (NADPH)
MSKRPLDLVCEVEPPVRADLMHVRHQIGVLAKIASGFLIPDNHIGRATVSSVAVAHEVDQMGGRSIACLNARDRNLLGFRRDLLTAAAYHVDEFLFVYGDQPSSGTRTGELTVRSMIEELREFDSGSNDPDHPLRAGVTTRLTRVPPWKQEADFLFVQVSCSVEDLLAWRGTVDFDGPVYAGVLVPPSAARVRKWAQDLPELSIPATWTEALDKDAMAGVALACDLALAIRDSSAFDGLHLIPGVRYREVAARLERELK